MVAVRQDVWDPASDSAAKKGCLLHPTPFTRQSNRIKNRYSANALKAG
jgi:hypothetical protein